jgi:hypothetical protein
MAVTISQVEGVVVTEPARRAAEEAQPREAQTKNAAELWQQVQGEIDIRRERLERLSAD